uniref:Uncharacterized protein n=1 Tax=Pyxicephalus adspersus TaxID=30357 RepID=A0AAV3A407_PYXAD|nr:TPA: hypothetical protein GDO54_011662 [Pyxicephalus adspersus]
MPIVKEQIQLVDLGAHLIFCNHIMVWFLLGSSFVMLSCGHFQWTGLMQHMHIPQRSKSNKIYHRPFYILVPRPCKGHACFGIYLTLKSLYSKANRCSTVLF